jgi:hypothetical protein
MPLPPIYLPRDFCLKHFLYYRAATWILTEPSMVSTKTLLHCTYDHPSSSGCYVAKDSRSSNDTDSRNSVYTSADLASLVAIENEAASLFPLGKTYECPSKLREEIRSFAYQKGFEITTAGWSICCSRCSVPKSDQLKRDKKIASGVAPQRIHRFSTRSV